LPLALSMDWLGSYDPALIVFLITPIAASALVLTVDPPKLARGAGTGESR